MTSVGGGPKQIIGKKTVYWLGAAAGGGWEVWWEVGGALVGSIPTQYAVLCRYSTEYSMDYLYENITVCTIESRGGCCDCHCSYFEATFVEATFDFTLKPIGQTQ